MTISNGTTITINPIGYVRSTLTSRKNAPRQGYEGAPNAWLELSPDIAPALDGIAVGDEVIVLTWFHHALRDVLQVYPGGDHDVPIRGVFSTRSPDRPNPIGLHRVIIVAIDGNRLHVGPLEAIDGTPIVDIKTVLDRSDDR